MKCPVPSLFCRSSCTVSLHDEYLAFERVSFLTICEFSRESCTFEERFSSCQVSCFLGGYPGICRNYRPFYDDLGFGGILLEELRQLGIRDLFHDPLQFAVSQFRLRLSFELRLGELNGNYCGDPFENVVSHEVRFALFQVFVGPCIIVHSACQCRFETGEMVPALSRVNVVGECVYIGYEGIVVLYGDLRRCILFIPFEIDRFVNDGFVLVQVLHESFYSSLVVEMIFFVGQFIYDLKW